MGDAIRLIAPRNLRKSSPRTPRDLLSQSKGRYQSIRSVSGVGCRNEFKVLPDRLTLCSPLQRMLDSIEGETQNCLPSVSDATRPRMLRDTPEPQV